MEKKTTNKAKKTESLPEEPLKPPENLPSIIKPSIPPEPFNPLPQLLTPDDLNNAETRIIKKFADSQEELLVKIKDIVNPKPKAWYKSVGIWFSILLFILMCYIIYLFVMVEQGKKIVFPF